MKSSSCIAGCVDVENPVDIRLIKLQEWAAKDKEFLRMLSEDNKKNHSSHNQDHLEKSLSSDPILLYWSSPSPLISVVPSPGRDYAVRQRYLRSYTLDNTTTDYKPAMSPAQRAKNWIVNYQLPINKKNKNKQQRDKSAGTHHVTSSSNCNSFFRVVSSFLFVCADIKLDVLD